MAKTCLSAARLQAMAQVRLIATAEVQRRIAEGASDVPTVGNVIRHERDAHGRNWTIIDLDRGSGVERQLRHIVDALRDIYDLE